MIELRQQIRDEVSAIKACDHVEAEQLTATLQWIDSGVELCRLVKPAQPPRHLVSYFACTDGARLLLVDHRNAQLWLPTGGHVEPGENPRTTVQREGNRPTTANRRSHLRVDSSRFQSKAGVRVRDRGWSSTFTAETASVAARASRSE